MKNSNSALDIFIIFIAFSYQSENFVCLQNLLETFNHLLYVNNIVVKNLQVKDIARTRLLVH